MRTLKTIDAHVGGQGNRAVVEAVLQLDAGRFVLEVVPLGFEILLQEVAVADPRQLTT